MGKGAEFRPCATVHIDSHALCFPVATVELSLGEGSSDEALPSLDDEFVRQQRQPPPQLAGRYNGIACPLCHGQPQYHDNAPLAPDTELALKTHLQDVHAHTHGRIFREDLGRWDCPVWGCGYWCETYREFRAHCDANHFDLNRPVACGICPPDYVNRYAGGIGAAIHQEKVHPRRFRQMLAQQGAQSEMVNEALIEGFVAELLLQEADKETTLNGCKRRRLEVQPARIHKRRMAPLSRLGGAALPEVVPMDWEVFLRPPPIQEDDDEAEEEQEQEDN